MRCSECIQVERGAHERLQDFPVVAIEVKHAGLRDGDRDHMMRSRTLPVGKRAANLTANDYDSLRASAPLQPGKRTHDEPFPNQMDQPERRRAFDEQHCGYEADNRPCRVGENECHQ